MNIFSYSCKQQVLIIYCLHYHIHNYRTRLPQDDSLNHVSEIILEFQYILFSRYFVRINNIKFTFTNSKQRNSDSAHLNAHCLLTLMTKKSMTSTQTCIHGFANIND